MKQLKAIHQQFGLTLQVLKERRRIKRHCMNLLRNKKGKLARALSGLDYRAYAAKCLMDAAEYRQSKEIRGSFFRPDYIEFAEKALERAKGFRQSPLFIQLP